MDRKALARKLREALFDHIEAGRRDALQDGAVDSLFERVLASCGALNLDVDRLHSTQKAILATWADQQQTSPCECQACRRDRVIHASDCAVHNGPALPEGPCDCLTRYSSKAAPPAIGDVNLSTGSIYAHKDDTPQWVSIQDPTFDAAMAATSTPTRA